MAKVLVVDDEATMVQMVTELLRADGHEVFPFTSGPAALDAVKNIGPDLVISDLYLDKSNPLGLEILKQARATNPPAVVIVITGFATIETAVAAMKKGAFDYLEKPFKVDQLKLCVERALTYNSALSENLYLRKQLKKKYEFSQIIGTSARMMDVYRLVERVANTDSTILILGESGTGKELVARALHFNSRRQYAPFVPINCSALPENLLESELFGHRKGAFTGAIQDKKGLFEEAEGGTIFLDEVGSMSAMLQNRLLRVLQEREVRRVGENTPIYVNVRVLAATNEPLEQKVKEGAFREDLYYRLNVIPITLPPLRDRLDDVPLLVAHFIKNKTQPEGGKTFQVTRQAMSAMCRHNWPGNVRELENAIERACVLCEANTIQLADLPPALQALADWSVSDQVGGKNGATPESSPAAAIYPLQLPTTTALTANSMAAPPSPEKTLVPLKNFLREQETAFISRALEQTGGNKEKAARLLEISVATLYRKLGGEDN